MRNSERLTLLHALQNLLGLLVLGEWVGEWHESANGAVTSRSIDDIDVNLALGSDTSGNGLLQTINDLGSDLLLDRIGENSLILLVLLFLLGLAHAILLGALLLLLSALLLFLDLVLAHDDGCEGIGRGWGDE